MCNKRVYAFVTDVFKVRNALPTAVAFPCFLRSCKNIIVRVSVIFCVVMFVYVCFIMLVVCCFSLLFCFEVMSDVGQRTACG